MTKPRYTFDVEFYAADMEDIQTIAAVLADAFFEGEPYEFGNFWVRTKKKSGTLKVNVSAFTPREKEAA